MPGKGYAMLDNFVSVRELEAQMSLRNYKGFLD